MLTRLISSPLALLLIGAATPTSHSIPHSRHQSNAFRNRVVQLSTTAASRGSISLAWTGSADGTTNVERKIAGTPWPAATTPQPPLASIATKTYTDEHIEAFATYTYRVKSGTPATYSNEVTVGPPPVGFNSVVAAPRAMQAQSPLNFASMVRMTFDANGDPTLAYISLDANSDGENDDSELFTITWNRARYAWNAPVKVDVVGEVVTRGSTLPFSYARDASNNTLALLYMVKTGEVRLASSVDGAASWRTVSVATSAPEGSITSPSLALAAGRVHAAFRTGPDTVLYVSGGLTDAPATWSRKTAPRLPGGGEFTQACINVALDASNAPLVSFCEAANEGYNLFAALWRPATNTVTRILDTDNHQTDEPALAMAIHGTSIGAVFVGARDDRFFRDHHLWYAQSSNGGSSFDAPVALADDGADAMSAPVSVSLDAANRVAVSAPVVGGNEGATKCGRPKLMRSDNGTAFVTCAPETRGVSALADPTATVGAFAEYDKLYVAFRTRAASGAIPAGLALWRER